VSFSWKERQATLAGLDKNPPELLILGAGVAGLSTAAHAARLGLNVLVIDKDDMASGASGHSTGLAHAGLRYLAQGRIGYVFREGRERHRLQELAPQWVQPFNFVLPVYKNDPFPFWMVRLGTWIYDILGWFDAWSAHRPLTRRHRKLSTSEIMGRIPGIRTEGLVGGLEYFVDAKLQDTRFTLGLAQQAARHGARILTHCSLESIDSAGSKASVILGRDLLSGKAFRLMAPLLLNATGAWIDEVRGKTNFVVPVITKSKGVHLIVDHLADSPLIMSSSVKGKVFFVIPIDSDRTLVGTTDTPVLEDVDQVTATDKDILDLLQQLFFYFPYLKQGSNLNEAIENYKRVHVRDVYWGVRPLLFQEGSTHAASREHRLVKDLPGFWSLPGVKLTAARAVGQETAKEAWSFIRKDHPLPAVSLDSLPGGELWDFERFSRDAGKRFKLGPDSERLLRYLVSMYGTRYVEVLQWAQREEQFSEPIVSGEPWILAQVAFAIHEEMVLTLNDLLFRRTKWAHYTDLPDTLVQRIASLMARFLGWTDSELNRNLEDYKRQLKKHRKFQTISG
jgi:glycerol-3-phosphate dehydrogenase